MRRALILAAWFLDDLRVAIVERLTRARRLRKAEEARVLAGFDLLRDEPEVDPTDEIPLPVEDLQRERRLDLDIDTAYHARAEQWLADIIACAELEWQTYADDRELRSWTLPLDMLPARKPGASLPALELVGAA